MPNKNLTLGLALLLTASVFGQSKTYTIRSGDTISGIASRFNTTSSAILRANGLSERSTLRLGQRLTIPGARTTERREGSSRRSSGGGYEVRPGDNDTSIARRLGMTPSELRRLNPGVNWRSLQIGQTIRTSSAPRASAPRASAPVATGSKTQVRPGDTADSIARRLGISAEQLRRLNPNVRWTRLQIGQNLNGPAPARVAQRPAEAPTPRPEVRAAATITNRFVSVKDAQANLRRYPDGDSRRVTTLPRGTTAMVMNKRGGWIQVKSTTGKVGWVPATALANAPKPASFVVAAPAPAASPEPKRPVTPRPAPRVASVNGQNKVVAKAQQWRGVRYRFGAMSRSATDCSGFTSQVFRSVGVRLPRTSAAQATVGIRVSRNELVQGDLVFFRTTSGRRISHVGIYIGGGRFIHASSGGRKVQINGLGERYYNARFVTARRIPGVSGNPRVIDAANQTKDDYDRGVYPAMDVEEEIR